MRFAPDPPLPPPLAGGADGRWLRKALYAACAVAVLSTPWPWLRMELSRVLCDPGFRTRTGSLCLLSCALLAMLTMLETGRSSRETVRPATAFVAAVTAGIVAVDAWNGPGLAHGAAHWTQWFWLAFAGVAAAAIVSLLRLPRRASAIGPE